MSTFPSSLGRTSKKTHNLGFANTLQSKDIFCDCFKIQMLSDCIQCVPGRLITEGIVQQWQSLFPSDKAFSFNPLTNVTYDSIAKQHSHSFELMKPHPTP